MTPEQLEQKPLADSIDRLLGGWQAVRPDLDMAPVGVITRLARVRAHIDAELEALFAQHGISGPGFAVIVTLSRLDEPEGVPQRRLMEELGLSSGTVSVRMDRLAEQGLVERRTDSTDRRNSRIVLTQHGRELFERLVPAHLANERRLLAALDADEQASLAGLLRKLLLEFEGPRERTGTGPRLGLVLAPAHVTIAMRQAVGLPGEPGLLVRGIEEGSPAAESGLAVGDVLVEAGGRGLRSLAGLHGAVSDAADQGALMLHVLRGVERREVTIQLEAASGVEARDTSAARW